MVLPLPPAQSHWQKIRRHRYVLGFLVSLILFFLLFFFFIFIPLVLPFLVPGFNGRLKATPPRRLFFQETSQLFHTRFISGDLNRQLFNPAVGHPDFFLRSFEQSRKNVRRG